MLEAGLGQALIWFACMHHILEILLQAAIVAKLGPSSGPTEKYFARFQEYFNSLTEEEVEEIRLNASSRADFLKEEDDVTREMLDATREFFRSFMSKSNGFQRDDYLEMACLIMV